MRPATTVSRPHVEVRFFFFDLRLETSAGLDLFVSFAILKIWSFRLPIHVPCVMEQLYHKPYFFVVSHRSRTRTSSPQVGKNRTFEFVSLAARSPKGHDVNDLLNMDLSASVLVHDPRARSRYDSLVPGSSIPPDLNGSPLTK